jgi:hypothetical protein
MRAEHPLIELIRKNDELNNLEVEHLLRLVHTNDNTLVDALQDLKVSLKWHSIEHDHSVTSLDGIVPFGTWTDIICEYLKNGIARLVSIGQRKDRYSDFAIGVLEELNTAQSFDGLVRILLDCNYNLDTHLHTYFKTVNAINIVASFDQRPEDLDQFTCSLAAEYLLGFLSSTGDRPQIDSSKNSWCVLALRGTGDAVTVDRLNAIKYSNAVDRSLMDLTIKAIKKRVSKK